MFGQVLLVNFPFTDNRGEKPRPVVVISNGELNRIRPDFIGMAVTTHISEPLRAREMLLDWRAAGLPKPSCVKPLVRTFAKSIIKKQFGCISIVNQRELKRLFEDNLQRRVS